MVVLITGKKDSGKTHYAELLKKELEAEGFRVAHLDGDLFRDKTKNNDYSDEGRLRNLMDASRAAQDLEQRGYFVLMSFIAPKKKFRDQMRTLFQWSRVVYIPGGTLWEGTIYERPTEEELELVINK